LRGVYIGRHFNLFDTFIQVFDLCTKKKNEGEGRRRKPKEEEGDLDFWIVFLIRASMLSFLCEFQD